MAVLGMPVGVQVMGQPHEDAGITAMARWLMENLAPVVAA
jgi:Asp-tRNA(Asn)/Glu-tRNA(Gln) amidotransferase A subunit family amidase